MTRTKKTKKLYIQITLLVFLCFITNLLLLITIMGIIMITPFGKWLVNNQINALILTIVSSYIASSILSTFVCYYFVGKLFEPLVSLSDASKKVAKGNFSISIKDSSSIPELQNAIDSFNQMVKELNKIETLSNDFVSNVSHEFKTPLSVIRSNINILESPSISEEEKQKSMDMINTSIDNISTLVSNVLKISRLDNKNVKVEKKFFRLDEQIRMCIVNLTDRIEEKHLDLDIDLEECILYSDEMLLSHVWDNLLSNAIKYSYENSTIGVYLQIKKEVVVTIVDHGCGMDEETKKHIFERFYQGETSHNKEGNGLGLTIVTKILQLCNAEIEVESEVNKGSKFTIKFSNKSSKSLN